MLLHPANDHDFQDDRAMSNSPIPTRRSFLASAAAVAAGSILPLSQPAPARASPLAEVRLRAASGRVRLVPKPHGETSAWCYNGSVPGSEIRVRQGKRLRVAVENGLDEETTVHWHGLRVPNAMDGVPYLTQKPIAPGEKFPAL
jgi:FtsP/CotA-like multicopper oxidase with cupredoxin domain